MPSEQITDLDALSTQSAATIGRAFEANAADPRDLVELYLEKAAGTPDVYAHLTADRARREAAAAYERQKIGLRRHPLDGVAISWKDLVDQKDAPTGGGSRLCDDRHPTHDAPVAAAAAAAGLAALGKTHLSELAFSGLGYNPMTATSPNAYDAARVPGGSSSGAASSVALGCAAAAIGSDTGGSVRIPAAWNGLVGLKTTHGLISLKGVSPLSPSLDTIGPLCRSVEDAGLLTAAMVTSAAAPDLAGASLKGKTLLIPETVVFDEIEPDIQAGFDAAIARFEAAGARLHRRAIPEFAEVLAVIAKNGAIVNTEGYALWGAKIEARPNDIFDQVRERFRSGKDFTADQIEFAKLEVARLTRSYLARIAGYDGVVTPTTPNHAPLIADIAGDEATYIRQNLLALRNTRLGNLFGLCSLTLPAGMTDQGLPLAVMTFGQPFGEAQLLRLGAAMEAALADPS